MINDNLVWLLDWFSSQYSEPCKKRSKIEIATIDNPGWYLTVSLEGTKLDNKLFEKIIIDRSENDWIHCFVKNNIFEGVGGALNLPEVLQIFREWAENE